MSRTVLPIPDARLLASLRVLHGNTDPIEQWAEQAKATLAEADLTDSSTLLLQGAYLALRQLVATIKRPPA
jgi:hypothetical protein